MKVQRKILVLLAIIFLTGFFIRVYPAAVNGLPLGHDAYYHARVAELMKTQGFISTEPWPEGGRPHLYPPAYHATLAFLSMVSGIPVLSLIRFVLPVVSSLLILSAFWLCRQFRGERAAILAAFIVAVSPFFLSAYDSPELFALFLTSIATFFFLKGKYWHTGLLLGLSILFSTITVFLAMPLALLLVFERKFRKIAPLAAPAVFLAALWYLPRAAGFSCFESFIGPFFAAKDVGYWAQYFVPAVLGCVLISFALIDRVKDRFSKLWVIWTSFFSILYATYFITPALYPWKMPVFISFGFAFLLADILSTTKSRLKDFFALFFIFLFICMSVTAFKANVFRPPLDENEYALIGWSAPLGGAILANPDFCANRLMLANKSCLLDINFECVPNKKAWFDYQNFFYSEPSADFFKKYSIDYIFTASKDKKRAMLEEHADKIYASWTDSLDSAIYGVVK